MGFIFVIIWRIRISILLLFQKYRNLVGECQAFKYPTCQRMGYSVDPAHGLDWPDKEGKMRRSYKKSLSPKLRLPIPQGAVHSALRSTVPFACVTSIYNSVIRSNWPDDSPQASKTNVVL